MNGGATDLRAYIIHPNHRQITKSHGTCRERRDTWAWEHATGLAVRGAFRRVPL